MHLREAPIGEALDRALLATFANEKGYLYKRVEAITVAGKVYRMKAEYRTEEEMAQDH